MLGRMRRFLGVFAAAAAVTVASPALALSPYLEKPDPAEAMKTPAYRYANMTNDEAYAELDRRGILYSRENSVNGVRAPIRLTGRLHGVLVRSVLPPEERASSIFEILDARLALSLDDFAVILASHGVDEVVHYTMYRPNMPKPGEEADADAADDHKKDDKGKGDKSEHVSHPGKKKPGEKSSADKSSTDKNAVDKNASEKKGTKPGKGHADKPSKPHQKQSGALDTLGKTAVEDGATEEENVSAFDLTGGENLLVGSSVGAKSPASAKKRARMTSRPVPRSRAKKATATKGTRIVTAVAKPTDETGADDDKPRGKWAPPGTRHPAGLAIDVGILKKTDGTQLSVAAHFDGKIGQQTCGKGAPMPSDPDAQELHTIVCEAHDAGIFTYTLTPNFDVAHKDHFHMEIKPGVTWFLYQ
ncbi:MAG: hypothetical protein U0414_13170 [Polyangiaceae bacterium]